MPNYITRPGGHDATYAAPSTATGVNMRLYVLKTSFARLAATLDRYVNPVAPAGVTFVPLGGSIVATFAALGKVVASNPALGSMREVDIAFFIPTVRFNGFLPTKVVFFAPYLFVDIPQAGATGREVHGYRKELGTSFSTTDIYNPAWVPNAADLTHIEAWSIAAPSGPLQRTKLVEVTPAAGAPINFANPVAAMLEFLAALMDDLTSLVSTITGNLGGVITEPLLKLALTPIFQALLGNNSLTVPILFLRQFRDPTNNTQADVQELLLAETTVPLSQLSGAKLPGPHALTFHDTASHPFGTELGTTSGVATVATLTAQATCDFTLKQATHV
jgi:hypothetical protein